MSMTGHAFCDDVPFENFDGGEQRRGPVSLVVVRHRPATPFFDGKARLGAIESLNLGLLVDTENEGVRGWVEVEPHHIDHFCDEVGIVTQFEGSHPMRLKAVAVQ